MAVGLFHIFLASLTLKSIELECMKWHAWFRRLNYGFWRGNPIVPVMILVIDMAEDLRAMS